MAHNGFPIRVASLADPNVFGQLDASGCVVGGMNGESMFVSTDKGVESTIVETTSFGDSWTALFSPRSFQISNIVSSIASYVFQVSATRLRWTDANGKQTTFSSKSGISQLSFSNDNVAIGSQYATIAVTSSSQVGFGDSEHQTVLNGSLITALNDFKLGSGLYDGDDSLGSAGQALISTGSGVAWTSVTLPATNDTAFANFSGTDASSGVPIYTDSGMLDAGSYFVTVTFKFLASPSALAGLKVLKSSVFISPSNSGNLRKAESVNNIVSNYGMNEAPVEWTLAANAVCLLESSGHLYCLGIADFLAGAGGGAYVQMSANASYTKLT